MMFSFEKTPHVCASCGSDEWHSNQTFHNRQKYWLPDEIEFWCHKCEAEVDVMKKEEYEEENDAEPAMTDGYTYKEENCECGLTEEGVWSDKVFDRFGCTCDEEKENGERS